MEGTVTEFQMELPSEDRAGLTQQVNADARKRAGVEILLVEDNLMNQELACAILGGAGHKVVIANDGIEAIAAVKSNVYDLILMDIRMPRMDGVTAARKIRELPGPAGQTPIIALTAHALPEQVRAYWEAGMDDFVAKPFKQHDLHEAVRKVLGRAAA